MTLTIDDFDYGRGFIPLPSGGRKRSAHEESEPSITDPDSWEDTEEPDGDS